MVGSIPKLPTAQSPKPLRIISLTLPIKSTAPDPLLRSGCRVSWPEGSRASGWCAVEPPCLAANKHGANSEPRRTATPKGERPKNTILVRPATIREQHLFYPVIT